MQGIKFILVICIPYGLVAFAKSLKAWLRNTIKSAQLFDPPMLIKYVYWSSACFDVSLNKECKFSFSRIGISNRPEIPEVLAFYSASLATNPLEGLRVNCTHFLERWE